MASLALTANLSASERQLRLLAENSTDMILIVRHDGKRVYASPACRTLLGWEPEEMLQISSRQAIHPEDIGFLEDSESRGDERPTTYTYRMLRKDGSYVWVESMSRALPTAQRGQPPERLVVVRDIDLRVAAERRLKESEIAPSSAGGKQRRHGVPNGSAISCADTFRRRVGKFSAMRRKS